MQGTFVELLDAASGALHSEHLVRLADIHDQRMSHEVCTEGDLGCLMTCISQNVLQQRGIEHDVAVVADEEIVLRGLELFDTPIGKLGDAVLNNLLVGMVHHAELEVLDGLETPQHRPHLIEGFLGTDIGSQQRQGRTLGNAVHGCGNLRIGEWSDIIKFLIHRYCLLCYDF